LHNAASPIKKHGSKKEEAHQKEGCQESRQEKIVFCFEERENLKSFN
jgi:hypothetical protein